MKEFQSVEEIFFYLEEMFTNGFSEEVTRKALDIFIKEAIRIKEDDLKSPTFIKFIRELS